MFKYPKARSVGFALLVFALFTFPGCCTTRDSETQVSVDSYKAALVKIKSNLEEDIRPGYAEALEASGVIPELVEARLGLVDDTVTLCEDTLSGASGEPSVTVEVHGD